MRLAHLVLIIALLAVGMTVAREPIGRVTLIVFLTGAGEVVMGLAALMALFQTLGSFGDAHTMPEHFEALAATLVVVAVSSTVMSGWLFAGVWMVVTFV